ncbi:hypothetical protein JB92DRAFT_268309 [Gautieria morchelliformis]|nr:hypothetical protein JB92DRAFT_268309 [Gautieria morchelliformis]
MKDPVATSGYGRRLWPGQFMTGSIFMAAASILSVVDITRATRDNGNDIPVKPAFDLEFSLVPCFQTRYDPRSCGKSNIQLICVARKSCNRRLAALFLA